MQNDKDLYIWLYCIFSKFLSFSALEYYNKIEILRVEILPVPKYHLKIRIFIRILSISFIVIISCRQQENSSQQQIQETYENVDTNSLNKKVS